MKTEAVLRKVQYDFPADGTIVVGLSGGADSTLLTHLLLERYGASRLHAVHVNHGIRGVEAARDEQFVRAFCASARPAAYGVRAGRAAPCGRAPRGN